MSKFISSLPSIILVTTLVLAVAIPFCSASCPHDCSGHGVCSNGACHCSPSYGLEDCSQQVDVEQLTDDELLNWNATLLCGIEDCFGQGVCSQGACVCFSGYTGQNCTETILESDEDAELSGGEEVLVASSSGSSSEEEAVESSSLALEEELKIVYFTVRNLTCVVGDELLTVETFDSESFRKAFAVQVGVDESEVKVSVRPGQSVYVSVSIIQISHEPNATTPIDSAIEALLVKVKEGDPEIAVLGVTAVVVLNTTAEDDASVTVMAVYGDLGVSNECPVTDGKVCGGHGRCAELHTLGINVSLCECDIGYTGFDCAAITCADHDDCSGHGFCRETGTCFCEPDYIGAACDERRCVGDCFGNGFCSNGSCVCDPGFDDAFHCQFPVCEGGGNCTDTGSCSFGECLCFEGYTGSDCSAFSCPLGCSGHGHCDNTTGICSCDLWFTGIGCERMLCPRGCSGHGSCDETSGNCLCDYGFTGADCTMLSCLNDCSGHGICHDGTCSCLSEYTGIDCSLALCVPRDCSGHGTCFNGTCLCDPGFRGADCSFEDFPCARNCTGRGVCITETAVAEPALMASLDVLYAPTAEQIVSIAALRSGEIDAKSFCVCKSGFEGEDCSKRIVLDCPQDCSGHGSCINGTCICDPQWEGEDCSSFIPLSCPLECSGHGLCQTKYGNCSCIEGWYGAGCEIEVMKYCPFNCSSHGTCVDGEYCVCDAGFEGEFCENKTVIYPCSPMCEAHGSCDFVSALCVCDPGWAGQNCTRELSCIEGVTCNGHGSCSQNRTCICDTGWAGEFCDIAICKHNCFHSQGRGDCVNGICHCRDGFFEEDCSIGPFEGACPKQCSGHGACSITDLGATLGISCACDYDYTGDDCSMRLCPSVLIDGYEDFVAQYNRTAQPIVGDAKVFFMAKAAGHPFECSGRGNCRSEDGVCDCDSGYVGVACTELVCPGSIAFPYSYPADEPLNEPSLPCSANVGLVVDDFALTGYNFTSFQRTGVERFRYRNSTERAFAVFGTFYGYNVSSPCSGQGECIGDRCLCFPGFRGDDCSRACPTDCNGIVCSGHGECGAAGTCECDYGWRGDHCGAWDCPNSCSGHGSCMPDQTCVCDPNYGGADCSRLICANNCTGNGLCVNGECQCFYGWGGDSCETRTCPMDLDGNVCFGRGQCVDGQCLCNPGWTGRNCTVFSESEIMTMWPASGDHRGGTVVTIFGVAYDPDSTVEPSCSFFIDEKVVRVKGRLQRMHSGIPGDQLGRLGEIVCISPSSGGFIGNATIAASTSNSYSESRVTFLYTPIRIIERVKPDHGPSSSETITVYGQNLTDGTDYRCRFYDAQSDEYLGETKGVLFTEALAWEVVETAVLCRTVSVKRGRNVFVEISKNGLDFTSDRRVLFKFYHIDRIYPQGGLAEGGQIFTVTGTNFDVGTPGLYSCRFGTYEVAADYDVGKKAVICMAPPWNHSTTAAFAAPRSSLQLGIGVDITDATTQNDDVFHYFSMPELTSVYPTRIAVDLGSVVTISGHDFSDIPGQLCIFMRETVQYSARASYVSGNQLECNVPLELFNYGNVLRLDVAVNGDRRTDYRLKIEVFSINITGVNNTAIEVGEPARIGVEGFGFTSSAVSECSLERKSDGSVLTGSERVLDDSHMVCSFPSFSEGDEYQLIVQSVWSGPSATVHRVFTSDIHVFQKPTFLSVSPPASAITSRESASISAEGVPGISDNIIIEVAGVETRALSLSASEISFVLPKLSHAGNASVVVLIYGRRYDTGLSIHFFDVRSIEMPVARASGGTIVRVNGANFAGLLDHGDVYCVFGEYFHSEAQLLGNALVECIAPPYQAIISLEQPYFANLWDGSPVDFGGDEASAATSSDDSSPTQAGRRLLSESNDEGSVSIALSLRSDEGLLLGKHSLNEDSEVKSSLLMIAPFEIVEASKTTLYPSLGDSINITLSHSPTVKVFCVFSVSGLDIAMPPSFVNGTIVVCEIESSVSVPFPITGRLSISVDGRPETIENSIGIGYLPTHVPDMETSQRVGLLDGIMNSFIFETAYADAFLFAKSVTLTTEDGEEGDCLVLSSIQCSLRLRDADVDEQGYQKLFLIVDGQKLSPGFLAFFARPSTILSHSRLLSLHPFVRGTLPIEAIGWLTVAASESVEVVVANVSHACSMPTTTMVRCNIEVDPSIVTGTPVVLSSSIFAAPVPFPGVLRSNESDSCFGGCTSAGDCIMPQDRLEIAGLNTTSDDCLSDCSSHGVCKEGTCVCEGGWTGKVCEYELRTAEQQLGVCNCSLPLTRGRDCSVSPILAVEHPLFYIRSKPIDVAITVYNLPFQKLYCRFSEGTMTPFTVLSNGTVYLRGTCRSPQTATRVLSVRVQDLKGTVTTKFHRFIMKNEPVISSVFPRNGAAVGDYNITLFGKGFLYDQPVECSVGDLFFAATVESTERVICHLGNMLSLEDKSVLISVRYFGTAEATSKVFFFPYALPAVSLFYPSLAASGGGTVLTIKGSRFPAVFPQCVFKEREGKEEHRFEGVRYNTTTITCPALIRGNKERTFDVFVSFNGMDKVSVSGALLVYSRPFVKRVSDPVFFNGQTVNVAVYTSLSTFIDLAPAVSAVRPVFLLRNAKTQEKIICSPVSSSVSNVTLQIPSNLEASVYDLIVQPSGQETNTLRGAVEVFDEIVVEDVLPKVVRPTSMISLSVTVSGLPRTSVLVEGRLATGSGFTTAWKRVSRGSRYGSILFPVSRVPPGNYSVQLRAEGEHVFSSSELLTSIAFDIPAQSVEEVWPSLGGSEGGTIVTVSAASLLNTLAASPANQRMKESLFCVFDDVFVLSHHWEDDNSFVLCRAPQSTTHGFVNLELSLDRQLLSDSRRKFFFHRGTTFLQLNLAAGPPQGGHTLFIEGYNFVYSPDAACSFNGSRVPALVVKQSRLECRAPTAEAGQRLPVQLTLNGIDFYSGSRRPVVYSVYAEPVITKLRPSVGTVFGGTIVTIEGRHFSRDFGFLFARFDSTFIFDVLWKSETEVVVKSPLSPHVENDTVQISVNGQMFSESGQLFTYYRPIRVFSVTPTRYISSLSATLTVTGDHFVSFRRGATEGDYGGCHFYSESRKLLASTKATIINSTMLNCPSPRLDIDGVARLGISLNNHPEDTAEDLVPFLFTRPPVFESITPSGGPIGGGTFFRLRGKFLREFGETRLFFSSSVVKNLTFASPEEVYGYVPSGSTTGLQNLSVTLDGVNFFSSRPIYMYYEQMDVLSSFPDTGPQSGVSTPLLSTTVLPSGFEQVKCRVYKGGVRLFEVNGIRVNDSAVQCSRLQSYTGNGLSVNEYVGVSIRVSLNGQEDSLSGAAYQYYKTPSLVAVFPSEGAKEVTSLVTIMGNDFLSDTTNYKCLISATPTFSSAMAGLPGGFQRIICTALPSSFGVFATVYLSMNGVDFEDMGMTFAYRAAAPRVSSARFTDSLSGVMITFEEETDMAGDPTAVCSVYFDTTTMGLLGSSPKCQWTNSKQLLIVFGVDATLVANNLLQFKGGAIYRASEVSFATSGGVAVQPPERVVLPTAIMSGFQTVSQCEDIFISASLSYGDGGRKLRYTWGFDRKTTKGDSLSMTLIDVLTGLATTNNDPYLQADNSQLGVGKFNITLTATSYIGFTSPMTWIMIERVDTAIPRIKILGHKERTIQFGQWTTLYSVVEVDPCNQGTAGEEVEVRWSLLSWGASYDEEDWAGREPLQVFGITTSTADLRLPPGFLAPGGTYTFQALAVFKNSSIGGMAATTTTVTVEQKAPEARIQAVSKAVPKSRDLMLDGSTSKWEFAAVYRKVSSRYSSSHCNGPAVWTGARCLCVPGYGCSPRAQVDVPLACLAISNSGACSIRSDGWTLKYYWTCTAVQGTCPSIAGAPVSESVLTIAREQLVVGSYSFSLRVATGFTNGTTAALIVNITDSSFLPSLSIGGPREPVSTSARTVVIGRLPVTDWSPSLLYEWQVSPTAISSSAFETATSGKVPIAAIIPYRVQSNTLIGGATYTFTLKVYDGTAGPLASSHASVFVEANSPPSGGTFSVSPLVGFSYETEYNFVADKWVDDAEHLPLTFQFFRLRGVTAGQPVLISRSMYEKSFTAKFLPTGYTVAFKLTVGVRINDRYGATTVVSRVIDTDRKPRTLAQRIAVVSSIYEYLSFLRASGQSTEGFAALSSVLDGLGELANVQPTDSASEGDKMKALVSKLNSLSIDSILSAAEASTSSGLGADSDSLIHYGDAVAALFDSRVVLSIEDLSRFVSSTRDFLVQVATGGSTAPTDILANSLQNLARSLGSSMVKLQSQRATLGARRLLQTSDNMEETVCYYAQCLQGNVIVNATCRPLNCSKLDCVSLSSQNEVACFNASAVVNASYPLKASSDSFFDSIRSITLVTASSMSFGDDPVTVEGTGYRLTVALWNSAENATLGNITLGAHTAFFRPNSVPSGDYIIEFVSFFDGFDVMSWNPFVDPVSEMPVEYASISIIDRDTQEEIEHDPSKSTPIIDVTMKVTRPVSDVKDIHGHGFAEECALVNNENNLLDARECTRTRKETDLIVCSCSSLGRLTAEEVPADCADVPHGDLSLDTCGVCGGDNSTCSGCDGVLFSGLEFDVCGVCNGTNSTCDGCDGIAGSGLVLDACGVCGGNGSSCVGCDGVSGSGLVLDICGLCGGQNDTCLGCDGVMGSGIGLDTCGFCGSNSACEGSCPLFLARDMCGVCAGDSTSCMGCDGIPNSGMVIDGCGNCRCSGTGTCANAGEGEYTCGFLNGTCGFVEDARDSCGICYGNNRSCCNDNGVFNGTDCFCDSFGESGGSCGIAGEFPIASHGRCNFTIDSCLVCNGSSVADTGVCGCDAMPFSGLAIDTCGICGGFNRSCCSFNGTFNGDTCLCDRFDERGGACGLSGEFPLMTPGICDLVIDNCFVCDGNSRSCCSENGTHNGTMCLCDDGFWGSQCEYICPGGSSSSQCSGRGQCDDGALGGGECFCFPGHCGTACELDIDTCDVCDGNNRSCCSQHGFNDGSVCICDDGYCGAFCDILIDNCDVCGGDSRSCCSEHGTHDGTQCNCDDFGQPGGYCGVYGEFPITSPGNCSYLIDNCRVCGEVSRRCCSYHGFFDGSTCNCDNFGLAGGYCGTHGERPPVNPGNCSYQIDPCLTCGGFGERCYGCDGRPYSGRSYDECGVCGGTNECERGGASRLQHPAGLMLLLLTGLSLIFSSLYF